MEASLHLVHRLLLGNSSARGSVICFVFRVLGVSWADLLTQQDWQTPTHHGWVPLQFGPSFEEVWRHFAMLATELNCICARLSLVFAFVSGGTIRGSGHLKVRTDVGLPSGAFRRTGGRGDNCLRN